MIRSRAAAFLGLSLAMVLSLDVAAEATVRVISDRTPAHLEAMFKHYEAQTGVKIEPVFVDKGLIARLKARPSEADLVITKTADILEEAKSGDLLGAFESEVITDNVPEGFRDPDNRYVVVSYRPRSIFASKERVEPGTVSSYDDLIDPKWKGRVCIRSGYHNYNLSLFSQMAADKGVDYARDFITGLHANLARVPKGNDRAQARGIYEDQCDLAVMNSYYMPLMLSKDEQRPWGEATYVIFPNQEGDGAYVMTAGAALTTGEDHKAEATALLEYLVGEEGQAFVTNTTYEYPVNAAVPIPEATRSLGKGQAGVADGKFKANLIPLAEIANNRQAVVEILDSVNFDSK